MSGVRRGSRCPREDGRGRRARGTGVEAIKLDSGNRPDFPGTLTILVDDEDLLPPKNAGISRARNYRVYQTPEGLKNHPTAGLVREALAERSLMACAEDS